MEGPTWASDAGRVSDAVPQDAVGLPWAGTNRKGPGVILNNRSGGHGNQVHCGQRMFGVGPHPDRGEWK